MQPERLIARGGFASVIRAYHSILERAVAVKVLHPEHIKDPVVRSRFLQEAEVVARADHPHIVRLLEYGASDTHAWIVLPFVEGESLRARMARGPLPWRDAARFGREIASAMDSIHDAGVVHRDLKPENVLIDHDGRTMLTDFGMSKPRRSGVQTGSGVILGTPGYIAPEAVRESPVSPSSDMYGLGILLWEAIAGFRPFERADPARADSTRTRMEELMAARESEPPRLSDVVPDVPRSLCGLVTRLLERAPTDRPRAAQVIEELAWIETGGPGELPGDAGLATVRVTRPVRSRPDSGPVETLSGIQRRTGSLPMQRPSAGLPLWARALIAVILANAAVAIYLVFKR